MPTSEAERAAAAACRWGGPATRVTALAGDASTRIWFRAVAGDGRRAVVAVHEAAFTAEGFPYLETTGLLAAAGLPVAGVLAVAADDGVLVLEDLGDDLLQQVVAAGDPRVPDLYRLAVGLLTRLQREGTPRVDASMHAGREVLDAERFRFELDFFFEHLVRGLRQRRPGRNDEAAWQQARDRLCADLEHGPRVLCHRDYHSRNLLVTADGGLGVVDHQDARLGPDTYDLASLLFDPYVTLPAGLVSELADVALAARGSGEAPDAFRRRLDLAAAQRLLKAAGTFAAQKRLRGRDDYLPYLAPALQRARDALARLPDHAGLTAALAAVLPDEFGG